MIPQINVHDTFNLFSVLLKEHLSSGTLEYLEDWDQDETKRTGAGESSSERS